MRVTCRFQEKCKQMKEDLARIHFEKFEKFQKLEEEQRHFNIEKVLQNIFFQKFINTQSIIGDLFLPVISTHCISSCVDRLHVVMHGFALPYHLSPRLVFSPLHLYTHVHLQWWLRTINCLSGKIHFFYWMKFVPQLLWEMIGYQLQHWPKDLYHCVPVEERGYNYPWPSLSTFLQFPSLDTLHHFFLMGDFSASFPFQLSCP